MTPNDLVLLQATCTATESALSYGMKYPDIRDCAIMLLILAMVAIDSFPALSVHRNLGVPACA